MKSRILPCLLLFMSPHSFAANRDYEIGTVEKSLQQDCGSGIATIFKNGAKDFDDLTDYKREKNYSPEMRFAFKKAPFESLVHLNPELKYLEKGDAIEIRTHFYDGIEEIFKQHNINNEDIEITFLVENDNLDNYILTPAKNAKKLFRLIAKILDSENKLYATKQSLHETLSSLVSENYLSQEEAEAIQLRIKSKWFLPEYESLAKESFDFHKRMSLAYFYRDLKEFDKAVYWLYYAGKDISLKQAIDLEDFFEKIDHLEEVYLFWPNMDEVSEAASKSMDLKTLHLWTYTDYYHSTAKNIQNFLEQSQSLVNLHIRHQWRDRDYSSTNFVSSVVNGLRKNQSVEFLDLSGSDLGDNSVIQILEVLKDNNKSKISKINLYESGITDKSGDIIIDLLLAKPHITFEGIKDNYYISKKLNLQIETLLKSNELRKVSSSNLVL